MKKKLLAAIFGSMLVLGACGGGDDNAGSDDNTSGGDTVAVDAEAVVQQKCISCHGDNLDNGSAPAIDKIGGKLSEEEIHDVIINGVGGMPGGIIKGDDADAVAAWLADKK